MSYNPNTAIELLKARMDRAGSDIPAPLLSYWQDRLDAAYSELTAYGCVFADEDDLSDNMLVADYAAYKILNRDNAAGMPQWLRLEIRERFLRPRGV